MRKGKDGPAIYKACLKHYDYDTIDECASSLIDMRRLFSKSIVLTIKYFENIYHEKASKYDVIGESVDKNNIEDIKII